MKTSSSTDKSNTIVEQYVNAYKQTQQYRFDPLDAKDAQLKNKQKFFTQLNSKLNSLLSAMDRFGTYKNVTETDENGENKTVRKFVKTDKIDDKFVTRKVITSQSDFVTASAQGSSLTGVNNIKVLQLANSDVYIGKQVDVSKHPVLNNGVPVLDADGKPVTEGILSDELKNGLVNGKGVVSFTLKIGERQQTFNIEYADTDTNEELLKKITKTINKTKDESGLGDVINASFIKDSTGTARLTFSSKNTGSDNKIEFIDADSNASSVFGIAKSGDDSENRNIYNDSDVNSFGYQRKAASMLNSRVNLNGVTVVRGSNAITDIIDGMTLNLRKVHGNDDAPTTLTTEIDTKAVETLLDPLIQSFNGFSSFITTGKQAHGNDASIIGLQNLLRSLVSEDLSGYSDTTKYLNKDTQPIKFLTELGFKLSNDNALTLSDSSKFEKILKSDDGPKLIADAINGFAAKVSEHIDRLSARDKNEGLIKSRLSSITQQIEANNKKIDQVDQSITKSSEAIRKQYMSYLSSYYKAQNQAGYLSMLSSQTSSNAYDSLLQQQATSKTQKS